MRKRAATASAIALLSLQACSNTLYGPERPFQAGKMGGITACSPGNADKGFLANRFLKAACASEALPKDDTLARVMLDTSFSLTNARCTDYFANKAGSQSELNIARSIVAPALTLLTGILSIINFKNDVDGARRADWEKGLSLASAATLSGLTIWEENFLFSADNIDDVRTLTNSAMSEYRFAVLGLSAHTFDTNVNYVIEYHMICTPGRIKGMVKQAIKDKKITVVAQTTPTAAPPAAAVAPPTVGAAVAGATLVIK